MPATQALVSETYGKLPLPFEPNRGQTDPQVKFLGRGAHHTLFLTSTDAVLVFTKREQMANVLPIQQERATQTVLRLSFLGANPQPRVIGLEELPGKANYFIGNDSKKWRTNVPTYAKVQYQHIYSGIDLVYYGNLRQLEYDFIVSPGADPQTITFSVQGADRVEVDTQGDLVLHTPAGSIHQRKPVIYQEVGGVRQEISGGYVLKYAHHVGFKVAAYNRGRPLVIDPVLFYSTYLGGSLDDLGNGIAVDFAGNAYVTGITNSPNFPTTAGAFQTTNRASDVFVTKLNPTGTVVYSTYLGGSSVDHGFGIAVDFAGNAYVTGGTASSDFPTTAGAFQTTSRGGAFVTKLNPTGSTLVYSTYLGPGVGDGIAVDFAGNAYVAGGTASPNFPTTPGAFQTTLGGGFDAFVTKLNPAGSALVYSTYLGGNANEFGSGIAVHPLGFAYVTGYTKSTNFTTTPGAFQTQLGSGGGAFSNAFVAAFTPGGTLFYSTYLGGSGADVGDGIAVDITGTAHVTGNTSSTNFPTTRGAFQTTLRGHHDAFVTRLNNNGTALLFSSYLGGSGDDGGRSIAVDIRGAVYVTGQTSSTDFPTAGAVQPTLRGLQNAFVTKLSPVATALAAPPFFYSTYIGGSGTDWGFGITADFFGNAYVTGFTNSTNFPTTPGAVQTSFGGGDQDAYVAKIADAQAQECQGQCEQVAGGGIVDAAGGTGAFSFSLRRPATTQRISGGLQFVNASGANVQSVALTSLVITGNKATLTGTCTNNGVPCTFTVTAVAPLLPSSPFFFTISVSDGPTEGGMVRSGSIQIRAR